MNENLLRSALLIHSKCFTHMVLIYDFSVSSPTKVLGSLWFIVSYRVEVLCHDISVHIPHHISQKIPSYNLRLAHESLVENWGKVCPQYSYNRASLNWGSTAHSLIFLQDYQYFWISFFLGECLCGWICFAALEHCQIQLEIDESDHDGMPLLRPGKELHLIWQWWR